MRATAASLETYDRIMEWHFRVTGHLQDPYKLSDVSGYVSRDALFKKLRKRYNMTEYSNQLKTKLKLLEVAISCCIGMLSAASPFQNVNIGIIGARQAMLDSVALTSVYFFDSGF